MSKKCLICDVLKNQRKDVKTKTTKVKQRRYRVSAKCRADDTSRVATLLLFINVPVCRQHIDLTSVHSVVHLELKK